MERDVLLVHFSSCSVPEIAMLGFSLCQVQSPLARVFFHDAFANYSGGFNSLVAVVSYSGYDLEDAVVFSILWLRSDSGSC